MQTSQSLEIIGDSVSAIEMAIALNDHKALDCFGITPIEANAIMVAANSTNRLDKYIPELISKVVPINL